MTMNSMFQILERRNEPGGYPLNENHWSNVVAWLLEQGELNKSLLRLLSPQSPSEVPFTVSRETKYSLESRDRYIDIEVKFENGSALFVEIKIDPSYQDQKQIDDQLSLLGNEDHFTLLAPLDLSRMVPTSATPNSNVLTWKSFTTELLACLDDKSPSLARHLIGGMAEYWKQFSGTPFEQMVMTIIEEQKWKTFYPDDFKAVFVVRFKEVWELWVEERPATGNGNPHQYLMTSLSSLANRKSGFRLFKTGNSRKPKPANWGYPKIYELSVEGNMMANANCLPQGVT
jgi:hypothetical protein